MTGRGDDPRVARWRLERQIEARAWALAFRDFVRYRRLLIREWRHGAIASSGDVEAWYPRTMSGRHIAPRAALDRFPEGHCPTCKCAFSIPPTGERYP